MNSTDDVDGIFLNINPKTEIKGNSVVCYGGGSLFFWEWCVWFISSSVWFIKRRVWLITIYFWTINKEIPLISLEFWRNTKNKT